MDTFVRVYPELSKYLPYIRVAMIITGIFLNQGTAYAASIVQDLDNGTIPRTPLLRLDHTKLTLPYGEYPVTGGIVKIGHAPGSRCANSVIGIYVNGTPPATGNLVLSSTLNYVPGNQPFNGNFAKVLYELRAAGYTDISKHTLN